jgi:hypothetical protein
VGCNGGKIYYTVFTASQKTKSLTVAQKIQIISKTEKGVNKNKLYGKIWK